MFDVKKFGISLGLVFAIGIFILGLSAAFLNWGNEWVELTATVYKGYNASFVGSLIGAVYAFIDGFIGGALFAWIYNKLNKR